MMLHTKWENKAERRRKVSGPPGLILMRDYIRIRITKAWELRAGLGNPNRALELKCENIVRLSQCLLHTTCLEIGPELP